VVITLLTLFAVAGLTFVIYAQAEAGAARAWRESESLQRPDLDPEMLLAYFLSQLIYDSDNPQSALRGHSLARNMYGKPGNTTPFNGTGRVHTDTDPTRDDYYQVDYTQSGAAPRDPDQYGSPNPPYTYPDFNHLFLAAQQASTGAILIPSYYRSRPDGVPVSLRSKSLPAGPEDGVADVKNLADSPGFQNSYNDSIWIDLGFPVMKAGDGRKFKPLFAPLLLDLDNRVNVNVHGSIMESSLPTNTNNNYEDQQGSFTFGRHMSNQGWGPWEVSLERVLSAPVPQIGQKAPSGVAATIDNVEANYLFTGNAGVPGRYDPNFWDAYVTGVCGPPTATLQGRWARAGKFYSLTEFESEYTNALPNQFGAAAPGIITFQANQGFPIYPPWYANSFRDSELWYHALQFNFFNPAQSSYSETYALRADRIFPASNLEALLRYGDRGSPALTSDLFRDRRQGPALGDDACL
jgi:hypothetical protein